jgi:hypothetical protein
MARQPNGGVQVMLPPGYHETKAGRRIERIVFVCWVVVPVLLLIAAAFT